MPTASALETPPDLKRKFNADLLASEQDRELAAKRFPGICHVLDHPKLREAFTGYDKLAISSRLSVHRFGLAAVALSLFALLVSAITPLLPSPGTPVLVVLFLAEAGGIIGFIIAAAGVMISGRRKKWLEARMMAEVIRIWHFQEMICRGKEIGESCSGSFNQPSDYRKDREVRFEVFLHEWAGSADAYLKELVENPSSGYQLLHYRKSTRHSPDSPLLGELFEAYVSLRFRYQANHALHKLGNETDSPFNILKWPSALLQQRVQSLSAFCLLASLLCSLATVASLLPALGVLNHPVLPVLVIVFLILTFAARTLQDGLAAPEDLQRYTDYAGKMRYLMERFEMSSDASEKLDLMEEAERAALEELKGFLRAHSKAAFII